MKFFITQVNHLKLLVHVNFIILFCILSITPVSANSYAQTITIDYKDKPLALAFKDIRSQTGYDFFYNESLVRDSKITIRKKNASIQAILDQLSTTENFSYAITDKVVVIKSKN